MGKQTRRAGSEAPYQTSEEAATVVQVRDGAGLMWGGSQDDGGKQVDSGAFHREPKRLAE